MRNVFKILVLASIVGSCGITTADNDSAQQKVWEGHQASADEFDEYCHGKIYLPVYSHIYHIHEHRTFDLTITVSIRNVSLTDTVFITRADYYDTNGEHIRQYITAPVYLKPMETNEIIIAEQDREGGSGANFIFEWAKKHEKNPPLFEAVMISTNGQQGLSFTTRGVQITD